MGQAQMCDGDDGAPAVFLVHNIEQAEVNGFCLTHFADFCVAFLQAIFPELLPAEQSKPGLRRKAKEPATAESNGEGGDNVNDDPPF